MSTTTITIAGRPARRLDRVADYARLTRPRISALMLVTVAASGYVARWGQLDLLQLVNTLVGTWLVAASASALNQWLERRRDARMQRTADRPLPAGRLSTSEALWFAGLALGLGSGLLALAVAWLTAAWAVLTWTLYVWVYTPLKPQTPLSTAAGAAAGALPVLIGWSATGAAVDPRALGLFTILYLWQFPHFMAIAWIYRDQYRRGGMKVLPVVDPSGRRAGAQAVVAALALVPVSFVPGLAAPGASFYLAAAFALGVGQLVCAARFLRRRDEAAARGLLRASLVYLPALLVLLMSIPLV